MFVSAPRGIGYAAQVGDADALDTSADADDLAPALVADDLCFVNAAMRSTRVIRVISDRHVGHDA